MILATICHAALQHRELGGLLVNYTQLPDAIWSSVAEFFSVGLSDAEKEIMAKMTKMHSKIPAAVFQQDSSRKQQQANEQLREAARRWLYPIYEKLESARLARLQVVDQL